MEMMQMRLDVQIDTSKCEDELYLAEGISNQEVEDELMAFMHARDPEVIAAVNKL